MLRECVYRHNSASPGGASHGRSPGSPDKSERLPDLGLRQRRKQNSKGSRIHHFSPELRLLAAMAYDHARSRRSGPDCPNRIPPGQIHGSRVDQHRGDRAGLRDLIQSIQVRHLGDRPAEVAFNRAQVQPFIRKISEQYDASSLGHGPGESIFATKVEGRPTAGPNPRCEPPRRR